MELEGARPVLVAVHPGSSGLDHYILPQKLGGQAAFLLLVPLHGLGPGNHLVVGQLSLMDLYPTVSQEIHGLLAIQPLVGAVPPLPLDHKEQ